MMPARRNPSGAQPTSRFTPETRFAMWFDDASLLCLEEVDWKIGNDQGELGVFMCDQQIPETAGFDETWCGMQEAAPTAYECT